MWKYIVNENYDYNVAPKSDADGFYYFQKISVSPEIDIEPKSTIACYEGAQAEFEVGLKPISDEVNYKWQFSDDEGNNWSDINDGDLYVGTETAKLVIKSTSLSMNGYLYRVKINTDQYACNLYTKSGVELRVEPNLPIANLVDDIIRCDDDSYGSFEDGIVSGWDLDSKISEILDGNENLNKLLITFHISAENANDLTSSGIENPDDFTNIDSPNTQEIFVRVLNDETKCFNAETSFNIIVEPLPQANPVTISRQCDGDAGDESQDGLYPFDTSNIQINLLNGQTDVTTYYYYKDDS